MHDCVFLPEKVTSCAYLVQSGLNDIFHWFAQSFILNIFLLSSKAEACAQFTKLNKEVSANSSTLEFVPCDRLLI